MTYTRLLKDFLYNTVIYADGLEASMGSAFLFVIILAGGIVLPAVGLDLPQERLLTLYTFSIIWYDIFVNEIQIAE